MAVKEAHAYNASLDNIYSEIIALSTSVGDCKASVDHIDSVLQRMHYDLRDHLKQIDSRLIEIEKNEKVRHSHEKFPWNLLHAPIATIIKVIGTILTAGILIGSAEKYDVNHFARNIIELIIK